MVRLVSLKQQDSSPIEISVFPEMCGLNVGMDMGGIVLSAR
jgi:hypothetical protein